MMTAKEQYKQTGKILFVFAAVACVFQFIFGILESIFLIDSSFIFSNVLSSIITFAPIYLIAFPISLLMFKKIPFEKAEPQKMKISRFFIYFVECVALVYVGNLIGTFLSMSLSNGQATNPVVEITSDNNFLQIIIITIIGPIIEEILFRKQIIDHTVMYGEKVSIIYSAFTFAMFHMNLYQFFYALALGLMFGYIYVKTRNIKYSMIIHIIINFFGGVVAPFIVSRVNIENLENIELLSETEIINMVVPMLILLAYFFVIIILLIVGVVFLIKNINKISFNQKETDIAKGQVISTAYMNVYYILFVVICLAFIIFSLFL